MKKGFTLIELLAVIVILAIIALIATPIVLNIINDTKNSAQEQSINNILHAAETYHASALGSSDVRVNRNIYNKAIENIEGEKPDKGVIYINKDGKVAYALKFGNNCYTKMYEDEKFTKEKKEECYMPFDYLPVSTNNAETSTFLNGEVIIKSQVEKIEFVTTNIVPSDVLGNWSVLGEDNKSIMAWYYDNDNNGLYELYIGQEGGVKANPNSSYLFYKFKNLTELNLNNLDTANVTNMTALFVYCEKLEELDLSNFDTSNATIIAGLFSNCTNLEKLDLSNFDTSNVIDMRAMFQNCFSLTELDLSNFDTSNVINMFAMFTRCTNLKKLTLSSFNTSKVTNMQAMFNECTNLEVLDLSNFDTSNVITMNVMFQMSSITDLKLNNFNFENATTSNMFKDSNITNIHIKKSGESFIKARLADAGKLETTNVITVN